MLEELCSEGACAHITANPLGDIATLAARLRQPPDLSGSVYDGAGHRHAATIGEADLFNVLLAGDLNPALRALLPAAVQSALHGDPDPLLRLKALSEGLIPNVPLQPRGSQAEREAGEEEDNALFLATSCEEKPFPWQRSATPATREAEARAALHGLPSGDLYPFDAATVWTDSLVPVCLDWPNAAPAPPAAGPLPNVPTLILSGAQDLRTPTSGARRVAAEIPDAQLLVVPYTGHSVIGSDFSDCAALAVEAFFGGRRGRAASRPASPNPTPSAPRRHAHRARLRAARARPARHRGRTLTAVLDTIVDLERQVIGATLQVEQEAAERVELRGAARRLRQAERLRGEPAQPHVRARGRAQRHAAREAGASCRASQSTSAARRPRTARSRSAPAGAPAAPSAGDAST